MTQLVGVLNVTPDSFSDGGQFVGPKVALEHAGRLFADGAALVDVGAESTNPHSIPITAKDEWQRLEPVLGELLKRYPGKISLDTRHPETAEQALRLSDDVVINDVTGMNSPAMAEVAVKHKTHCIIGHLPDGGVDPQAAHRGELIDDIQLVVDDLLERALLLQKRGLPRGRIILDPGIGFGKTPELNRRLLEFARYMPEYPVMIGYSRKRFLGEHRMELAPNLAAGRAAVAAGAAYLRVHDVAGHRQLLQLVY